MDKQLTADIVSDFFINKSIEFDNPAGGNLTPIKLQKLITYAYVWYLGLRGKRLFEEKIKRCHHGYSVTSQFERFKTFGFIPIVLPDFEYKHELSDDMDEFLENLWDAYGRFEGSYLSKLQCRELPYKESEGFFVDDNSIKQFYTPDRYREYLPLDLFD